MVAATGTPDGPDNILLPSEQSPLIEHTIRAPDGASQSTADSAKTPVSVAFRAKTNIILVCLAFVLMLGTNMQPGTQSITTRICPLLVVPDR